MDSISMGEENRILEIYDFKPQSVGKVNKIFKNKYR